MTDDVKIKVGIHGTNTSVKDLKKVKKETHNLGDATDTYNKKASRTAQIWGTFKTAAKSATVAFAGIGSAAVVATKKFAEFDKNFTSVVNLLNDKSFGNLPLEQGIEQLRKDIIDLSIKSGESLDVLNKSFFDYISATGDAVGATQAVAAATDLAAAGVTDASIAVDGITNAMNAFGAEAGNAKEVSSLFFAAQVAGKTSVEALASSIGKAAPLAAGLGISFQELLASTSTLTVGGISTSEAITGLKATLSNIVKPTQEAAAEAAALGIDFSQAGLEADGFQGFLNKIIGAADGNKESLVRLFGSVEAVNAVFSLAKNEGAKFNQIMGDLKDTQKVSVGYADAVAKANGTLSKRLDRVASNADAALVNLGKFLNTDFAPFGLKLNIIQNLNDMMERFNMAFQEDTSAQLTAYAQTRLALLENKAAQEELIAKKEEANFLEEGWLNFKLSRLQTEEEALIAKANTLEEQMIREQELKAENDELDNERIAENNATKEAENKRTLEQIAADREKEALATLSKEQKELIQRQKMTAVHYTEMTKQKQLDLKINEQIDIADAKAKEQREIAQRTQFLKLEHEYGTTYAKMNKFFQDDRVNVGLQTAQKLAAISHSENSAFGEIAKAANAIQIGMSTYKAAMDAYAALAPIPIVGPALGATAAAAAIAYGGQQLQNMYSSANKSIPQPQIRGANEGGIVTSGIVGQDTEPFLLSKNEMVVPADVTPTLLAMFDTLRSMQGNNNNLALPEPDDELEPQEVNVTLELADDASRLLQEQMQSELREND
jgi:TP901 family phage tail tape measure protein